MKNLFSAAVLPVIMLLLASCSNNNPETTHPLHGNWEWAYSYVGTGENPPMATPESTGITKEIRFTPESTYTYMENGVVVASGNYVLDTNKHGSYVECVGLSVYYYELQTEVLMAWVPGTLDMPETGTGTSFWNKTE